MYIEKEFPKIFSHVVMIRLDSRLDSPAHLLGQLLDSCFNGNIEIFKSNQDQPIGYVAWASVSRETLHMTLKTQQLPKYTYEFSDGKIMLIYDIAFNREWAFYAKYALLQFLKKKRFFSYYKDGKVIFCRGRSWRIDRINSEKIKLIK